MANWSPEQVANARMIVAVGLEMGMSQRDILTGIMTAMQESGLRNLQYGDRDSLGLFQQRPSQGWGTRAQVTDPLYATRKFFSTLKGVSNRGGMTLWQAAQAVQRSAYPSAYAKWENDARRIVNGMGVNGGLPYPLNVPRMDLAQYGGLAAPEGPAEEPTKTMGGVAATTEDAASPAAPGAGELLGETAAPSQPGSDDALAGEFPSLSSLLGGGARQTIVQAARAMIGTPYSWGGGGTGGKSRGIAHGAGIVGFDCSGLVQYALAQVGIKAPRIAADQMTIGTQADINSLQPGDLVAARDGHHIAIYIGGGKMIEAPYTGARVRESSVRRGMVGIRLNIGGGGFQMPNVASGTIEGPQDAQPPGIESPQPLMSFPGI